MPYLHPAPEIECAEYEEETIFRRRYSKIAYLGLITLFGLSVLLWISFLISSDFAEQYSRTLGGIVRRALAAITGILPFSLAETLLVILFLVVLYSVIRDIVQMIRHKDEGTDEARLSLCIIAVFLIMLTLYNFGYASCNRRYTLEDNIGMQRAEVDAESLFDCLTVVQEHLCECIDDGIRYRAGGSSCMPYSYGQLNEKINESYEAVYDEFPFLTRMNAPVKRIALSPLMTYTHISGVYIPYTGEANINTNYPDYVIVFSQAHEMAHQRGIAREDEANFMAFMVLYENGEPYMRYAALMEAYDYLTSALYEADYDLYKQAVIESDMRIHNEQSAYYNFFTQYQNSAASRVTDIINDTSIKIRGQSSGSKSYDRMVELTVAYFRDQT